MLNVVLPLGAKRELQLQVIEKPLPCRWQLSPLTVQHVRQVSSTHAQLARESSLGHLPASEFCAQLSSDFVGHGDHVDTVKALGYACKQIACDRKRSRKHTYAQLQCRALEDWRAMNPRDIRVRKETIGWHRFITYETGVLPTEVYFEGPRGGSRDDSTLVIEVKQSSLEAEPMRYPPRMSEDDTSTREERARARFPEWRDTAISEDEFAAMLDEFVFVPFRLVVAPE